MSEATNGGGVAEIGDALRDLLRAGLALGVAEPVRRLSLLLPPGETARAEDVDRVLDDERLRPFVESVRADPAGIVQLVKEVWSRGDSKERLAAARALGVALSRLAPHKSIGLSRELAAMARNQKEADLVGAEAIGRLLDANPPLVDRVKQFVLENEPWIRRAAIAGLVAYATRKRKKVGLVLEIILLLAERHEAEIRSAVKWAVKEASAVDWKATAKALADWARQDPTGGRAKLVKQYVTATAEDVRSQVQRVVFAGLAKFVDAAPARGR